MEKKELREIIYSKIEELPTLPAVVPKLLSLIEDSKSNASDITDVISHDPALTSKILKVANSAYYGFSEQISELNKSVTLLGFNMVKSLALSIGVMKSLPTFKKNPYFSQDGLWTHSLAVATLIQELGKRHCKKDANESLFIIGLLHDVGKIVLDQFFHEKFLEALEYANKLEKLSLHIAERAVIGIDHCEVASMLLKRWKFPQKIINPIDFHHMKELPEEISVADVSLLRIANALSQELKLGDEGNSIPNEIGECDLKLLNMEAKDLEEMRTFANKNRDKVNDLLKAMI
ncbi:MAG: HDOD domain-containing protein [Spirochaetota bacterium]|nr:HDOD domain-containing protein [Spirochaetota bacterium]